MSKLLELIFFQFDISNLVSINNNICIFKIPFSSLIKNIFLYLLNITGS